MIGQQKNLKIKKYFRRQGSQSWGNGQIGFAGTPGFTITTDVCDLFYKNKKKLPQILSKKLKTN